MMAPSRGIHSVLRLYSASTVCRQCQLRAFSITTVIGSGHNRWSKIKHDKSKADAAKNKQRSIFSQEIATASKLFGPEPGQNPRLADLITKAKKEGFAKASIEAAIARGQGRSLSGANLESITVEGILPNNVAVIVDCETDNKLRTLSEVRLVIKDHGGTATPTSYLFSKKGKITFEVGEGVGAEDMLEAAIEAGAEDVVETDDGKVAIFTEPSSTRVVGDAISRALNFQIATSELIWIPNEDTKVDIPSEDAVTGLRNFLDDLHEKESSVQGIAMNLSPASLSLDPAKDLQGRVSV